MTAPEVIRDGNAEIARYNRRLLWLAAVCAAAVLAMQAAALVKVVQVATDAQASAVQAAEQTAVVREVLDRQDAEDSQRERIVAEAVAQIAAQQDEALAFHDASVKQYLEDALRLLDVEVNLPANKERRAPILPPSLARPTPRTAAPAPAPRPAPQPAPAPPCETAGKSDRCKR